MTLRFSALAAAVLAVSVFAAPAEARSVRVALKDVNLATEAGAQVAYDRIAKGARRACRHSGIYGVINFRGQALCEAEAVADAVTRLNQPQLTVVAEKRNSAKPARFAAVETGVSAQ